MITDSRLSRTTALSLAAACLLPLSAVSFSREVEKSSDEPEGIELVISKSKDYQKNNCEELLKKTFEEIKELTDKVSGYKRQLGVETLPIDIELDKLNISFEQAIELFQKGSQAEATLTARTILIQQDQLITKVSKLSDELSHYNQLDHYARRAISEGHEVDQAKANDFYTISSLARGYFMLEENSAFNMNKYNQISKPFADQYESIQSTNSGAAFFFKAIGTVAGLVVTCVVTPALWKVASEKINELRYDYNERHKKNQTLISEQQKERTDCLKQAETFAELLKRYESRLDSLWNHENFPALKLDKTGLASYQELAENLKKLHPYLATQCESILKSADPLALKEKYSNQVVPHFGIGEPEQSSLEKLIVLYKEKLDELEAVLKESNEDSTST